MPSKVFALANEYATAVVPAEIFQERLSMEEVEAYLTSLDDSFGPPLKVCWPEVLFCRLKCFSVTLSTVFFCFQTTVEVPWHPSAGQLVLRDTALDGDNSSWTRTALGLGSDYEGMCLANFLQYHFGRVVESVSLRLSISSCQVVSLGLSCTVPLFCFRSLSTDRIAWLWHSSRRWQTFPSTTRWHTFVAAWQSMRQNMLLIFG